MTNSTKRQSNKVVYDELYTPMYAVTPLVEFLEDKCNLHNTNVIWEACGIPNGITSITSAFEAKGYPVIETGIHEEPVLNYLTDKHVKNYNIMVTNPPYSHKDEFLLKAFKTGKPFAMLLPHDALFGVYRHSLYKKYKPSFLLINRRIDFTGKKKPHSYSFWILGNFTWWDEGSQVYYIDMDK